MRARAKIAHLHRVQQRVVNLGGSKVRSETSVLPLTNTVAFEEIGTDSIRPSFSPVPPLLYLSLPQRPRKDGARTGEGEVSRPRMRRSSEGQSSRSRR